MMNDEARDPAASLGSIACQIEHPQRTASEVAGAIHCYLYEQTEKPRKGEAAELLECAMEHLDGVREWIPVTERVPNAGVEVLIFHRPTDPDGMPCCAGSAGCDGAIIETGFREKIDGDWHWMSGCGEVEPTHWMPLPAPPQTDK